MESSGPITHITGGTPPLPAIFASTLHTSDPAYYQIFFFSGGSGVLEMSEGGWFSSTDGYDEGAFLYVIGIIEVVRNRKYALTRRQCVYCATNPLHRSFLNAYM